MENFQPQLPDSQAPNSVSPLHSSSDSEVRDERMFPRPSRGKLWISFLVIALVFGFAGGLLSPFALRLYDRQMALFGGDEKNPSRQDLLSGKRSFEDTLVTDLVEKNAPGVVSIVVTRDVPKMRQSFGSQFPGFRFFDPFGSLQSPGQNGGQEGGNASETEKKKIGSGSGFFVSSDGMIVTNKHVVSDLKAEYTVLINGGKEYQATVLARDPANDIALLKVEGNDFPVLALGDSDLIKVGQTAIAIGNPLGEFANTVTRGIISGLKRSVSAESGAGVTERLTDILQIDAAINPGNSGGPLFDLSGQVIGVNVAMAQGAENIGFALPINSVKKAVEQVRTTGKISTPYLGVRYVVVNDLIQKENNLPYNYGALVLRGETMTDLAVIPGSPADKAGVVENDIILEINGERIDEDHPLGNRISKYGVGDEITLRVWHKGDTKDVKVTLEERK